MHIIHEKKLSPMLKFGPNKINIVKHLKAELNIKYKQVQATSYNI
jgi:hypothetical protein